MKKNEEKGGFGLVLLLSLVGGTEKKKKKKKEEELGFLSVFCLAGKLKGLYYDCSSKIKGNKKLKKESGCWFVVRVFLYM